MNPQTTETTETTEETFLNKSTFPDGPWKNEPDKIVWVDKATDLDCMIHRSSVSGALCGYVGVPPTHPLYKKHYQELDIADDISVHGRLTYSDACQGSLCHIPAPGRPKHVWWFGFDCGHYYDVLPKLSTYFNDDFGVYRTVDYVKREVRELARQLKELETTT